MKQGGFTLSTVEALHAVSRVNIARLLRDKAAEHPDKDAIVRALPGRPDGSRRYERLTFGDLDRRSDALARGFQALGVTRGVRTIVMIPPCADFFAVTFGLFKAGAVPVLIDPGMGMVRMVRCLEAVEAAAFVGIAKATLLPVLFRRSFKSVKQIFVSGRRLFPWHRRVGAIEDNRSSPFNICDTLGDDMAAILFTSGSTGPPKGTVYTHGMFAAQIRMLANEFGYGPEEKDLATFPLFALFDTALGMTSVIPEMDATRPGKARAKNILGAINDNGVTHMFGSPALLDTVGREARDAGLSAPGLRRVMTAGAPVAPGILGRFKSVMGPDAEIFTPYGATEALPVSSLAASAILHGLGRRTESGWGTCVGRAVAEVEIRIIAITDDPVDTLADARLLSDNEIGEIIVRGPNVTRAYYRNESATALAKIRDGESLWHRMGDCGYFDSQGLLWFCGRKSHRVILDSGAVLFTDPVEGVFNAHPAVRRSALVGVGKRQAQIPVIVVELMADHRARAGQALASEILDFAHRQAVTQPISRLLFHPDFPVDIRHNAKIFREKLAVWAAGKLG